MFDSHPIVRQVKPGQDTQPAFLVRTVPFAEVEPLHGTAVSERGIGGKLVGARHPTNRPAGVTPSHDDQVALSDMQRQVE